MNILQAENVSKSYLDSDVRLHILKDINLSVEAGEFVSISGQSGCGKSTLLHILGLLDKPDQGSVIIDGKYMTPDAVDAPSYRNAKLGFIFQFHYLMDDLTAAENAVLPMLIANKNMKKSIIEVENMLRLLDLGNRLNHYPYQLSGGEQQRVALARSLVNHPKLVLADEPTGNLDPENSLEVLNLMLNLNQELGIAFIMVTHDAEIAKRAISQYKLQDGILLKT